MPLYEYRCLECDHQFEVIQKFSDAPIEKCPKCGGPVRKLMSSPAIQFKGSGWYITDYARAGKSDEGKAASSGDAKPAAGKSESSSESKTEAKTESTKSETKSDSKPSSTPSTS